MRNVFASRTQHQVMYTQNKALLAFRTSNTAIASQKVEKW